MRRVLRILKWLGVSLSALLFVSTLILWWRGLGHDDWWGFQRFEPEPRWTTEPLAGMGTRRWCIARAVHGRLWLGSQTMSPVQEFKSEISHIRQPMTADEAKKTFKSAFRPRQESRADGSYIRAWNWLGVGFHRWRSAVDPDTGQPTGELFYLAIPFWMLALVFGLWPTAVLARRLLRPKRYAQGMCPKCGHDLRATPDRCPECGTSIAGC